MTLHQGTNEMTEHEILELISEKTKMPIEDVIKIIGVYKEHLAEERAERRKKQNPRQGN
jgi:hypothetical protein